MLKIQTLKSSDDFSGETHREIYQKLGFGCGFGETLKRERERNQQR